MLSQDNDSLMGKGQEVDVVNICFMGSLGWDTCVIFFK
jgi:hypothetical protein